MLINVYISPPLRHVSFFVVDIIMTASKQQRQQTTVNFPFLGKYHEMKVMKMNENDFPSQYVSFMFYLYHKYYLFILYHLFSFRHRHHYHYCRLDDKYKTQICRHEK